MTNSNLHPDLPQQEKKPEQQEQAHDEQRQELRLNNQLTVIIELDSSAEGEPTLVVSKSIDISANGLRMIAPQAVPTDNILRCCIRDNATDRQFLLVTEVKWCKPYLPAAYPASSPTSASAETTDTATGDYWIGLSLFDSEGTDIVAWKNFIAQRVTESH